MPRPKTCRRISCEPKCLHFKPQGIPLHGLEICRLELDALEALRLADLEDLSQEEAAAQMGISRATFGRIVQAARRTVADALINGKAVAIAGGKVEHVVEPRWRECRGHRHHHAQQEE